MGSQHYFHVMHEGPEIGREGEVACLGGSISAFTAHYFTPLPWAIVLSLAYQDHFLKHEQGKKKRSTIS